jgi:tetratricopeptide (TPR) repeat protein
MSDNRLKAVEEKKLGNAAFKQKLFEKAVLHYTKAIELDSSDHIFYSNRSGCYTSMKKFDLALKDSDKCIELRPSWFKGYNRKA